LAYFLKLPEHLHPSTFLILQAFLGLHHASDDARHKAAFDLRSAHDAEPRAKAEKLNA
jgi:hypothetical protein